MTVDVSKVDGAEFYLISRHTTDGIWEAVYDGTLPGGKFTDYSAPEGDMLYSVRAVNESGSSDFYEQLITVDKPANMAGLTVTYDETTGRVSLAWNSVNGAQVYEIARQTLGSNELQIVYSGWYGTSFTDLNPPEGDVIYLVRAIENSTKSPYVVGQVFIEPQELVVGKPVVTATVLDTQAVSLMWDKAENATEYTVFRRTLTNPGWELLTTTAATGYLDTTATLGDVKYYVMASRSLSVSDSEIVEVSVSLSMPFVEASTDNPDEVGLAWNEVPNATYYSAWIKTAGDTDWRRIGGNIYGTEYTDTNPPSGIVEYAIQAHSGSVTSGKSAVQVDVPLQLANPILSATVQSGGTVSVTWNNVANALGYVVYRRAMGATGWTEIGSTASSERTFSDANLPFGEYEYCVTAVNADVYSESNIVSATITLDSPTSLVANSDSSGVTLTWDAVERADYYSVWIKVGSNAWERIANKEFGTSFTDVDPPAGTVRYGVRAHSGSLASTRTMTTPMNVPLEAPERLNAVNSSRGIVDLTWTAVSDATLYDVWIKDSFGNWQSIANNVVGTNYSYATSQSGIMEFAVTAKNGTLVSDYSTTEVDVTVPIKTPVFQANVQPNGTVSITWNAVDGGEIYGIFRCISGTDDWIDIGFVEGTSFEDVSVEAGKYDYAVIAYGGFDESNYNIVTVDVPEASNFTVTNNGNGTVSLNWSLVATATKYTIWRQAEGGTQVNIGSVDGATASFTDSTVTEGTYTYFVRAVRGLSTIQIIVSDAVTVAAVADPLPPFGPPTLAGTFNSETGKVELAWNAVAEAVRYSVWYNNNGTWTRLNNNAGGTSIAVDSPLTGTVEFQIRAHNADNVAKRSNNVMVAISTDTIGTPDPLPPFGPPTLTATYNSATGKVELSWNAVADAVRYSIMFNDGSGTFVNVNNKVTATHWEFDPQVTGVVKFFVRAHNAAGEFERSKQVSVTVDVLNALSIAFGNYDPYEELLVV